MSCTFGGSLKSGWGSSRACASLAMLLMAALASLAGCKVDNVPAGALVLELETDLSVPKDIDHLRVEWSQDGHVLHSEEQDLGPGHMLLPAELRVDYPGNDRPVLIRALASRASEVRIERSALTPVPHAFVGMLRLSLGFLCTGQVTRDGESSCGLDQTCRAGVCSDVALRAEDVPRYDTERATRISAVRAAADGGGLPDASVLASLGDEGCFDVASCFASPYDVDVSLETCAFTLPGEVDVSRLNIALRQPLGLDGLCDNGSCFVVIDPDPQPSADDSVPFDGYRATDGRVRLPPGVCARIRKGEPLQVSLSLACNAKFPNNPACGAWSSVQTPRSQPERSQATGDGITVGVPGALLGQACAGAARQACGMCGTQGRECRDGLWGDWASCSGEGVCVPGSTEACGRGGLRTCGGDCAWGQCLSQSCEGSTSRACGNCGTQTRRCDNGVWSEWSECSGPGVCAPNSTQSCGSEGTQSCGGSCQWGACGNQRCPGSSAEACGKCGTRTRSCDADSGKWSEFGACMDEGACAPDSTRACGSGGTQSCRGDCSWDGACTGQMCEGESTRSCGNCGTQTRTCNTDTGSWSAWSSCSGQGECSANATRACGSGGTQVCGGNCRWDAACTGQSCSGAALQSCGNCGVQTRSCDSSTGRWSAFSACMNEGSCAPGDMRSCGSGGTQRCGNDCRWPTACSDQKCSGESSRGCGRCGTQSRTCDPSTGRYGDWGECTGQGECAVGDTTGCGSGGSKKCNADCRWDSACTGQSCPSPTPTKSCDRCGVQMAICDGNTGRWTGNYSACTGQRDCNAGDKQSCGTGGERVCGTDCRFDAACKGQKCLQSPPAAQSCGMCGMAAPRCNSDTGTWEPGSECTKEGECMPGQTRDCGPDGGKQKCGTNCQWESTCACSGTAPPDASCGKCGKAKSVCDTRQGVWVPGTCSGEVEGGCEPGKPVTCGGTGTQTCDASCKPAGDCKCPDNGNYCDGTCGAQGTDRCGPNCLRCDKGGPGTTASCESGQCKYTCSGTATDCGGGKCVDLKSDEANCGGCGAACGAGQTCQSGGCACDDENLHLCKDGVCHRFDDDKACGSTCAVCKSSESCSANGVCVPKSGGPGGSGGGPSTPPPGTGGSGGSPSTPPPPPPPRNDGGSGGGPSTPPPPPPPRNDGGSGGSPTTPPPRNDGGSGGSSPTVPKPGNDGGSGGRPTGSAGSG